VSKFVIVGAGGHAKACIEVLDKLSMRPEYCVSLSASPKQVLGIDILSEEEALASLHDQGIHQFFVAIGDNQTRCKTAQLWMQEDFSPISIVSPSANVAKTAAIGFGVLIMPNAVIGSEVKLEDYAIVNSAGIVEHESLIGYGAHVAPGSVLGGKVTLGDRSLMGIGSVAIDGTTIGKDIIVGAGAVVVGDLTTPGTYIGVPARLAP
jgi:UDP-perosamine 4-acetyltransferase